MAGEGPPGGDPGGAARDAVYGAVEAVGRAEIAGELRGGGRGACGPVGRALGIAAGQAGLPDPRAAPGAAYDEEAAAAVLTTMLHYLLSAAAVPSQRRVRIGGAELDVAVPDAAALGAGPGTAAVAVCVVGRAGGPAAERRVRGVEGLAGPAGAGLWVAGWSASSSAPPAGRARRRAARTYLASDGSFAALVPDLAGFAASAAVPGRGRRLGLVGAVPAAPASVSASSRGAPPAARRA